MGGVVAWGNGCSGDSVECGYGDEELLPGPAVLFERSGPVISLNLARKTFWRQTVEKRGLDKPLCREAVEDPHRLQVCTLGPAPHRHILILFKESY